MSPTSSSGKISVALVDDHALFREGLREILESTTDLVVAGEAGNSSDAVTARAGHPPGRGAAGRGDPRRRRAGDRHPDPDVLAVHPDRHPEHVRRPAPPPRLLAAGISGYLLKSIHRQELLAAVRGVYEDPGRVVLAVSRTSLAQVERPAGGGADGQGEGDPATGRAGAEQPPDRPPARAGRGDRQAAHAQHLREAQRGLPDRRGQQGDGRVADPGSEQERVGLIRRPGREDPAELVPDARGEPHLGGGEVHLQMHLVAGARHRDDMVALGQQPAERQPARAQVQPGGDILDRTQRVQAAAQAGGMEAGVAAPPVAGRQLVGGPDAAGEETPADRAGGHHADAQPPGLGQQAGLGPQSPQRVLHRERGHRMDGVGLAELPQRPVGQADMADLPGSDQVGQPGHALLDRGVPVGERR